MRLAEWSDDVAHAQQTPLWWPAVEASPRWIRVRVGGTLIADSRRALLLLQYRGPRELPTYYLPREDVAADALVDRRDDVDVGVVRWSVQADGERLVDAAWMPTAPQGVMAPLRDHVSFSWQSVDWYEEDELLIAHARDPHKRVDTAHSSRRVQVEIAGELVADSVRPVVLFETLLPTRFYLPPADVRTGLLEPSDTISLCPYKGRARYWSVRVGDSLASDVVWSYPLPVPENPRIAGLLCFYNEHVDLIIDGRRQERPRTPWS